MGVSGRAAHPQMLHSPMNLLLNSTLPINALRYVHCCFKEEKESSNKKL